MFIITVLKSLSADRPGDQVLYADASYLYALSTALASCHISGIWNFKVAFRFLGKFIHPLIKEPNSPKNSRKICVCPKVKNVQMEVLLFKCLKVRVVRRWKLNTALPVNGQCWLCVLHALYRSRNAACCPPSVCVFAYCGSRNEQLLFAWTLRNCVVYPERKDLL